MSEIRMVQRIPSPNFTTGRRSPVRLVVLHSTESPERSGGAVAVARYFQKPATRASAHYVVDARTVVECVDEGDTGWHAPGANASGIGIEMVGRAAQTAEQWADPYSSSVIHLTAVLCAEILDRWDLPAVYVDSAGLVAGRSGITMHRDVSTAWKRSTHWDPGPAFPIEAFVRKVAELRNGG